MIAILMFPGTNDHENVRSACTSVGLNSRIIRWNQTGEIGNYDGYIIPGGFSYEDRVRAGVIAAKNIIVEKIREEAAKGKVVLGICNGCQILAESGLVGHNQLALAPNINPHITGYFCRWIYLKNCSNKKTAFNYNVDNIISIPIAHGEGRFCCNERFLTELENNHQILYKYCDVNGDIKTEFPVNPNGSVNNIAAVCNENGNVMAIMPHPERATWKKQIPGFRGNFEQSIQLAPSSQILTSMKRWIDNGN